MFGLVHQSLDCLNAGWIPGGVMKYDTEDEKLKSSFWRKYPWWKEFSSTVKHIHCYNQLIVYMIRVSLRHHSIQRRKERQLPAVHLASNLKLTGKL